MSIEGRIAIDVNFADSAPGTAVQSLKKIALTDTQTYTTGKVALASGTCGTTAVSVGLADIVYRDASGALVVPSGQQRAVFSATPLAIFTGMAYGPSEESPTSFEVRSRSNIPVVLSDIMPTQVRTTAGTASYTLVLYGT